MIKLQAVLSKADVEEAIRQYIRTKYSGYSADTIAWSVSAGSNDPREYSSPHVSSVTVEMKENLPTRQSFGPFDR